MVLEKTNIQGNIRLSTIQIDKFKTNIISLSLTAPLTKEAVALNLILSGLLRRGTQKYPTMAELNHSLDMLYGSYIEVRSSHIGENISLTVTAEAIDNAYTPDGTDVFGGVMDIVSQILLSPVFTRSNFDVEIFNQERNCVLDSLNSEINNTRSYSIGRCAELMREGVSQNPSVAELKTLVAKATLEDVRAHYSALLSLTPLDVFYIGRSSKDEIENKLLSAFSSFEGAVFRKLNPIRAIKPNKFSSISEAMPVSQGKLALGFSLDACISQSDKRYYTALVLNEIFGGSAASKLFLNVREKMGLCYYCSSSYSIYTGILMVSCGIESEKAELVKSAILDQLEEIQNGNISPHEFEAAKRSIENSYRQIYDNPFDIQSFYSGRSLLDISDGIEECRVRIAEVDAQSVIALAKEVSLCASFFIEGNAAVYGEEEQENE